MDLKKELNLFQNAIPSNARITFEAHYWGVFKLLTQSESSVENKLTFFAESHSHPFGQKLAIQNNQICLHRPDESPIHIADTFSELLGDYSKVLTNEKNHIDRRKKVDDLIAPSDFVITAIDDPAYFETAEAYLDLVNICDGLADGVFAFDEMSATENDSIKKIELKRGQKTWTILLERILFDNEIIIGLNKILLELGNCDFEFATSINEKMEMMVLKLRSTEYQTLKRMGLLI